LDFEILHPLLDMGFMPLSGGLSGNMGPALASSFAQVPDLPYTLAK